VISQFLTLPTSTIAAIVHCRWRHR